MAVSYTPQSQLSQVSYGTGQDTPDHAYNSLHQLTSDTLATSPLGAVLSTTGMSGKLGYQSGWTDAANGRVHMGARWYDPAAGQFTSRDTAHVNPDPDPDSAAASPFAYTGDDPLTAIDPTGHLALVDGYNASKAIAGSASNIQHVIASQPKAPPPAAKPKAPAKASAGRKAAAKPAVRKVADAAPGPTATVGAAGHAICDGVGQCGSVQSFAPGGVNFLPSVKSQAQDLTDQFRSKLSSVNPAAKGAKSALKKAEKASVSALASLAALPGLSASQRTAISGLETVISDVRLRSPAPQPATGLAACGGSAGRWGSCDNNGDTGGVLTWLAFAGALAGGILVAPAALEVLGVAGAFGAGAAGATVAGLSDADPDLPADLSDTSPEYEPTKSLASDVADSTGGKLKTLGSGYSITIPNGNSNIVVRVMAQGGGRINYYRISIAGKQTFTATGAVSTDPALTHIPIGSTALQDILNIISGIQK